MEHSMTCHVCGRQLVLVQWTDWFWSEVCPGRYDGVHPPEPRIATTGDTTPVQPFREGK